MSGIDFQLTRKPKDTPLRQQKLDDWHIHLSITGLFLIYFLIGCIFIPLGAVFNTYSYNTVEYKIKYDGDERDIDDCAISQANVAKSCQISFTIEDDITGPIYVYYELDHFYQNHRRYVKSRSADQLRGDNLGYSEVESSCYPLISNGSTLLNPCGLIANTFFNDIITLSSTSESAGYALDTDGISWSYDTNVKFKQVDGFVSVVVVDSSSTCTEMFGSSKYENCKSYINSDGTLYYYWYPNDDSVQYLYETYSSIISPIEGVENEHFINWMRTAGLSKFRKFYGKIDTDLYAGNKLIFNVTANYEVGSFDGTKALIITNLNVNGRKSNALGNCYIIVGSISLFISLFIIIKKRYFSRITF